MTPWTMWPALGQPVWVRPSSVNERVKPGIVFASAVEKRALLLRMGSAPESSVYLDTLARASGISCNALKPKLEALEQEGFVASTKAPAGPRYQLTEDGRRFRTGFERLTAKT
jgi:predicted transcriptional regulator